MKLSKESDLDAHYYVKNSSLQNTLAKVVLRDVEFKPTADILDIGCGDGRLTAEMAVRASQGEVIGLDSSPSMVDFASQNFPIKDFPNLQFQLGKAEETRFATKFDLITSFSSFHWVKNPEKTIYHIVQSLKFQGELVILTYPKESPYYTYLESALLYFPAYAEHSAYHEMLSTQEYKESLITNGLEICDFELKELVATYATPEELKNYIKGWLNCYIPLPNPLQPSFLDYVCKAVLNDPNTHTVNNIQIPYLALVVKAKKRHPATTPKMKSC